MLSPSLKRFAVSIAAAATLILASGLAFGAAGYAGASAVAFLGLAWRHDTQLGTCFPLAVLFLMAIAVLLLLFFLAVAVGSG